MGREETATVGPAQEDVQLALVAEAFVDRPLPDLLDWLVAAAPQVASLELGSGGYAPHPHCDIQALLLDPLGRKRWADEFRRRGLKVAALNAWGNPLHPDPEVGALHDRELRDTVRLAAALGVNQVVALAGCPAAVSGDRAPNFAAGGWLPYLEDIYDSQWEAAVAPYWSDLSEFACGENPELRICVELHPGTAVYNVETFSRLRALGTNLYATLDPSHFFWQGMDAHAVIAALRPAIGHVHAKDVVFNEQSLATGGVLDHRWRGPWLEAPWRFATVGDGHDAAWWAQFFDRLAGSPIDAVAIEHEDPSVAAEDGVVLSAQLLASARSHSRHGLPAAAG